MRSLQTRSGTGYDDKDIAFNTALSDKCIVTEATKFMADTGRVKKA